MNPRIFFKVQKRFLTLSVIFLSGFAFASTHTVKMKSISYDPKVLEIKVGDSVEWVNSSYTEHSATSFEDEKQNAKFDTGLIQPQKSSQKIEFKQVGAFSYHCSVHGKAMTGKINVSK